MMFKKILVSLAVVIIVVIAVLITGLYIYRHAIIQYYAQKILQENLPAFIKVDSISFDFTGSRIFLKGFKVLNPPGFTSEYLLSIREISCRYIIKGEFIPDGIEIPELSFSGADLEIERLHSGRINAVDVKSFVVNNAPKAADRQSTGQDTSPEPAKQPALVKKFMRGRKLSEVIKLPDFFVIKNAKGSFLDRLPYDKPHLITIDSVNGEIRIRFDDNYSKILSLESVLKGILNSTESETIKWTAYLDPTTPRLTMSNRLEAANLDMLAFRPYYDRFSPFIFNKGWFSGTLIFDFNNGNIGSTNEIRFSYLDFSVKQGYENSQVWETNIDDLVRYFTTPSGDIVFDFKLKGDMSNPSFQLGPISKKALTSMAIDKMASYAMDQVTKQNGNAGAVIDKAKGYIDILKSLANKK